MRKQFGQKRCDCSIGCGDHKAGGLMPDIGNSWLQFRKVFSGNTIPIGHQHSCSLPLKCKAVAPAPRPARKCANRFGRPHARHNKQRLLRSRKTAQLRQNRICPKSDLAAVLGNRLAGQEHTVLPTVLNSPHRLLPVCTTRANFDMQSTGNAALGHRAVLPQSGKCTREPASPVVGRIEFG